MIGLDCITKIKMKKMRNNVFCRNLKIWTVNLVLLLSLFPNLYAAKRPRNVILMIGDGMGIAQVYAGRLAANKPLALEHFPVCGFSITNSSDNFVTDSGAGGSAISMGEKTKNGMIGMTPDSVAKESILEMAERNQLATGIVVSCAVTHATPADFIAHQISRNMYEEIADDYLKTDVDVVIGGGLKYFQDRQDGRNLIAALTSKNYQVCTDSLQMLKVKNGKLFSLLYEDHHPSMPLRGDILKVSTLKAIELLQQNKKGFFMMVEGSQIDWACHANKDTLVGLEMKDFDRAVQAAYEFAVKDKNTLVIVTADHETGGMTFPSINPVFSTKSHTGVPVPVFAFGPGAVEFGGFMQNTEFKNKISKLLKLK